MVFNFDAMHFKAFWLVCAVCEEMAPYYFDSSLAGVQDSTHLLSSLLPLLLPELHEHLVRVGFPIELVGVTWFASLFANSFPAETVYRIWDAFFFDGPDALLFVAIAFLRLTSAKVLAIHTMDGINRYLIHAARCCFDADTLLLQALCERNECISEKSNKSHKLNTKDASMSRVKGSHKETEVSAVLAGSLLRSVASLRSQGQDMGHNGFGINESYSASLKLGAAVLKKQGRNAELPPGNHSDSLATSTSTHSLVLLSPKHRSKVAETMADNMRRAAYGYHIRSIKIGRNAVEELLAELLFMRKSHEREAHLRRRDREISQQQQQGEGKGKSVSSPSSSLPQDGKIDSDFFLLTMAQYERIIRQCVGNQSPLKLRTVSAALFHALNFGNDAPSSQLLSGENHGNPRTRIRLRDLIACCAIFSTGEGFNSCRKKGREGSRDARPKSTGAGGVSESVAEDKLRLAFRAYGDNKAEDKTSTRVSKGKLYVTSKDVMRIMQIAYRIVYTSVALSQIDDLCIRALGESESVMKGASNKHRTLTNQLTTPHRGNANNAESQTDDRVQYYSYPQFRNTILSQPLFDLLLNSNSSNPKSNARHNK